MPWVTRHLRVGTILVLLMLLASVPLTAGAATTLPLAPAAAPALIITELQTTGNSSMEEFVELYNTTSSDIDLSDTAHAGKESWKLQFFSAASTAAGTPDWTKPSATLSLAGVVPAYSYFVLAGTGYAPGGIDSDQAYSSRLSDSGGGVQLVTASPIAITYYDRLMWKQVTAGQPLPAAVWSAPAPNGSLQRLPNDDSEYVNSDGSLADFTLASDISPKDMWHAPLPPQIPDAPELPPNDSPIADDPAPETETPQPVDNTGLDAPRITELLPNPAAPLADGEDEFIELYNPNEEPFNLAGYTLEVGTTTLHDFTFGSGMILQPLGYTAFYSRDTNLSLSNTGGQARLFDADNAPVSETVAYGAADDGRSWAWDGTNWVWTTAASPGSANVIVSLPGAVKPVTSSAAGAKTTAKKTTAKPAAAKTTSKVKGTSVTKTKTAAKKKAAAKTPISTTADVTAASTATPIHTAILVTVVAAAVLYAGYEYRHDLRNKLRKLRYNRAVRAYARQ